MKKLSVIIFILLLIMGCSCERKEDLNFESDTLRVFATKIFLNEDFLLETIAMFEEVFKCRVKLTEFDNANDMMEIAISQKDSIEMDIVWGLDNTLIYDAVRESLFTAYKPKNIRYVEKENIFDDTFHIIPVCYSYLAFIFNSYIIANSPETFGEMQDGKFKNQIIIMDPRKSSIGKAMLFWTIATFGENGYGHFWRSIKDNIFFIADNYDDAYNMFLAGEAPLVIGYDTTPVFHKKNENLDKYRSSIPQEGGFKLIKGVGIMKTAINLELSERFVEFLLSTDYQELIPSNIWMYPVNKNIDLTSEYDLLPKPQKDFTMSLRIRTVQRRYKGWIRKWERIMLD